LRRFQETVVAVEKQKVLRICEGAHARVCVWVGGCPGAGMCLLSCSPNYPAHKAYAAYCHLWHHLIFQHYLINGTIFGRELLITEYVFCFSVQLLSKTFLILRRIQRDIVIRVKTSSRKVAFILGAF
jgi:hypothetical protein